jgi:nitroreductase
MTDRSVERAVRRDPFTQSIGRVLHRVSDKLRRTGRRILGRKAAKPRLKVFHETDRSALSDAELMAFMRHDAHRIEKSFYNRIFDTKRPFYEQRRDNVLEAVAMLERRGCDISEPTIAWAREIAETFEHLEDRFIHRKSTSPQPIDQHAAEAFLSLVASRRSSRVWAAMQPPEAELDAFARHMIDAARWAPNSGDRQPIRFKIIVDGREKALLAGLKEEHCYAAPCLIFVGSDRRFYGGLGQNEAGIYIDAAAAAMQMVLTAHAAHYGVCWNHFSRDLIDSRERNRAIYGAFAQAMKIPDYVEPIAIIAFGHAAFHPPVPPRMSVESMLL